MTQNQLQNAANIEVQRHDTAVEEENARHNTRNEELDAERNQIQSDWNAFQEDYMTRQQNWKETYDTMYLEFQTANEERKRELEAEMNDINRLQAEADKEFKEKQAEYYKILGENDTSRVNEAERHNKETEGLQYLEWQSQDKWYEYQNYANLENIGLKREDLNLKWSQYEHQVQYDWTTAEIKSAENLLRKEELEWQKEYQNHLLMNQDLSLTLEAGRNKIQSKEAKSNEFRNYAMGIGSIAQSVMTGVNLFKPAFSKSAGSLSQGVKYGKEIAEALLFK